MCIIKKTVWFPRDNMKTLIVLKNKKWLFQPGFHVLLSGLFIRADISLQNDDTIRTVSGSRSFLSAPVLPCRSCSGSGPRGPSARTGGCYEVQKEKWDRRIVLSWRNDKSGGGCTDVGPEVFSSRFDAEMLAHRRPELLPPWHEVLLETI